MASMTRRLIPAVAVLVVLSVMQLGRPAGARPQLATSLSSAQAQSAAQPTSRPVISYQGTLTDETGTPITATLTIAFTLYDVPSGGTAEWGPEQQEVEVSNGLFHVLLGSVTPLDPARLGGELYLEIAVEGERLWPRELVASAPYALRAGQAELIWPAPAVGGGAAGALPGFMDTLYYAVQRGLTVEANRSPASGSLANMFTLDPGEFAGWTGVTADNPVVLTISYGGSGLYLNGVLLSFTGQDTRAVDYKVEYYEDDNGDGSYVWTTFADVTGNPASTVYHAQGMRRVLKIRVAVAGAGTTGNGHELRVATIQAQSSVDGKGTGPMLDVGGDKMYGDLNMNGNAIVNCGALVEANLQTASEKESGHVDGFEQGDVLCWGDGHLVKCAQAGDRMVQAVADAEGRPVVIGAEPVKVVGPVHRGDFLVASAVPGYAMAATAPETGTVIAQALEDLTGERGIVWAMIRKF